MDEVNVKLNFSEITTEILDRDKDTDIMYKIVESLKKTYRKRLVKIILFDSHRDDQEELWTGIDIMVFLKNMTDRWEETKKLTALVMDTSLEFEVSVRIIPFDSSLIDIKLMPRFLENVLQKGVDL
jgi:hypothetical protein